MKMRDKGLNMLVVDDNPVLVSVLSEIFRECGHEVRVASNGFLALAEIRNGVPDVLLSDLSMPGMSGYELLSVVRRRFAEIRVIAMSGAYAGRAIPPGVAADAFYPKGQSSIAQLIQTVRTIWGEESYSLRSATPVWISEISIDHPCAATLLATCPECLRPFRRDRTSSEPQQRETCPHCSMAFELALVREPLRMDETLISVAHAKLPMNHRTLEIQRGDGALSGRMHSQ